MSHLTTSQCSELKISNPADNTVLKSNASTLELVRLEHEQLAMLTFVNEAICVQMCTGLTRTMMR